MNFPQTYTLKQIATLINAQFIGDPDFLILGLNEIHCVRSGDIVFVDHPKYYDKAFNSQATTILINKQVDCPKGKSLLISDDPFRDFNKLITLFKPFEKATQQVAPSAKIGEGTIIQPNVFIGNKVQIGKNCLIHSNVSINDDCIIGDNVVIHSGSVLGADAFYYKKRETHFEQLKSGGRVVIENDVHLGALCTIDRGVTADTLIRKGTKIDNQVHIGHDTIIGERCIIASQTGIAGCVVVEDEVTLWGQVGVASSVHIGAKAVVLAQSGVSKSLKGGQTYFGSPAEEIHKKYRQLAKLRS